MYTVIGFKRVVSKKNGLLYFEIILTYEHKDYLGNAVEVVFIDSPNIVGELYVGAKCNLFWSRFGEIVRVSSVELLDS